MAPREGTAGVGLRDRGLAAGAMPGRTGGRRRPLADACPALASRGIGLARVAAACTTLLAAPAALAKGESLEYAVKATYLHKLTPFVEWPSEAFDAPNAPVKICVVGDDPFGDMLDRAVRDRPAGERPIAVKRLAQVDRNTRCHVMYVTGSEAQPVGEILEATRGRPVLTVTDAAASPEARGVVHFVLRDGRVRFEMDDRAAAENGVAISSKLLSLAVSVRRRG